MNHECSANTLITLDGGNNLRIYANRLIKKDEVITHNYTNVLNVRDINYFPIFNSLRPYNENMLLINVEILFFINNCLLINFIQGHN